MVKFTVELMLSGEWRKLAEVDTRAEVDSLRATAARNRQLIRWSVRNAR